MASGINYYRAKALILRSPRGPSGPIFERKEFGDRNTIVLNQQFVEVVNSGDPSSIKVRLNQQYAEVVNSGDPASIKVRLNQQYIEVVCTFGVPVLPPPKKEPPGKTKKNQNDINRSYIKMQQRDQARKVRRFSENSIVAILGNPPSFIPGYQKSIRRTRTRIISIDSSGHTVKEF